MSCRKKCRLYRKCVDWVCDYSKRRHDTHHYFLHQQHTVIITDSGNVLECSVLSACLRISCCYDWFVLCELSWELEWLSRWAHRVTLALVTLSDSKRKQGRRDAVERQSWSPFETFRLATKLRHVSTLIHKRMSSGLVAGHRPALLSARFLLAPASDSPTELITRLIEISSEHGVRSLCSRIQWGLTPQIPSPCLNKSYLMYKLYSSRFTQHLNNKLEEIKPIVGRSSLQ